MNKITGRLYLHSNSVLQHSFHSPTEPDSKSITEKDLSDAQLNYINLMYEYGVPPSTIANIMSQVFKNDGKPGEFIASTIKNISKKTQQAMDVIAGIDADFNVAKRNS